MPHPRAYRRSSLATLPSRLGAVLLAVTVVAQASCSAGFSDGLALSDDGGGPLGVAVGVGVEASSAPATGVAYGSGNPGTKALQRLNVVEYDNTVHDLTGTSTTPAADTFPADDTLNNFDNIAAVLQTSPGYLEAAVSAAVALGAEVTGSATDATGRSNIYLRVAPCAAAASGSNAQQACLRQMVADFGLRAWRRPLASDEAASVVAQAQTAGAELPAQVGAAVTALLTSPYFLFRVELDPSGSSKPHALSGYELASRLSYFLWRSCPDDALLASAKSGALVTDAGLKVQLVRMLGAPRASSLVDGFAIRWLGLEKFADAQLDARAFPQFNASVQQSMQRETRLFLADFMVRGAPLTQLLTANYTYLDDTLAGYYGLTAPGSDAPTRVTLASSTRRLGVLSQGTVLITGSSGLGTSPIRRGYTVLRQLLCTPPPSPPPDIPAIPANPNENQTSRQLLLAHVASPSCAACHVEMDNLGFAFEGFDASGRVRTTDNNLPIDTTGTFAGTLNFADNVDLLPAVAADPRFPRCTTKQLLTYALGRVPDTSDDDSALVEGLAAQLTNNKMSVPVLLQQIVLSQAFRSRHG